MFINLYQELRLRYFKETIKHLSLEDNFYTKYIKSYGCSSPNDLPLLERNTIINNSGSFILNSESPFNLTLTGCTTNKPLMIYSTASEKEEVRNYYKNQYGENRLNTLVITNGNHGNSLNSGSKNLIFLPLKFKGHFELIFSILRDGLETPNGKLQIKRLVLGAIALKALYQYALENNINEFKNLDIIEYYSSHVEEKLIRDIKDYFSVSINAFYGLSEFPYGIAGQCSSCKNFHFPVTVLPEIIESVNISKEPEYIKLGELALSSLFPFTKNQFFLRYKTGDKFTKEKFCLPYGDHGYKFLGRITNDSNTFISPIIVSDILSYYSKVKRNNSSDMVGVLSKTNIGTLRFLIINEGENKIIIDCEESLVGNFKEIIQKVIAAHKKNNIYISNLKMEKSDNSKNLPFLKY